MGREAAAASADGIVWIIIITRCCRRAGQAVSCFVPLGVGLQGNPGGAGHLAQESLSIYQGTHVILMEPPLELISCAALGFSSELIGHHISVGCYDHRQLIHQ